MIGTTTVGFVANGQVVPGNTYNFAETDITPSNAPTYASIVDQTFDPGLQNVMQGTVNGDYLRGYAGNDTLFGKDGNDTLEGWDGNDYVNGGAGNDILYGGTGNDTFLGGSGNDSILGGGGNDTFVYAPGDGNDPITDFNTGNTGTLNDGNSTNNDFIDLSGFYDNIRELHADQADDGILNQSNNGVDGVDYTANASSGSMAFSGASADNSSFTSEKTGVVCFTAGTAILTPWGDVLIEHLRVGKWSSQPITVHSRSAWITRPSSPHQTSDLF